MKCPGKSCVFKDELRKIEDHIRLCNSMPVKCPYSNVGCRDETVINNTMREHLLSDIVTHAKLLMECIDIVRNEVASNKQDIAEMRNENDGLKQEMKEMRNENDELKQELREMKEDRERNRVNIC